MKIIRYHSDEVSFSYQVGDNQARIISRNYMMRLTEILEPRNSHGYNSEAPPYNFDNVRGIFRDYNAAASHAERGTLAWRQVCKVMWQTECEYDRRLRTTFPGSPSNADGTGFLGTNHKRQDIAARWVRSLGVLNLRELLPKGLLE